MQSFYAIILCESMVSFHCRNVVVNLCMDNAETRRLGIEHHVCELQLTLKSFASLVVSSFVLDHFILHFLHFMRPSVLRTLLNFRRVAVRRISQPLFTSTMLQRLPITVEGQPKMAAPNVWAWYMCTVLPYLRCCEQRAVSRASKR